MTKPYQMLIIPLTIWSGLEQGFFLSDYTAGFISCLYGVGHVGWVLMTYGVCDALFSISFGVIIKYTGRPPIYLLGAGINLAVIIVMLTWDLTDAVHNQEWIFFVLAGMWGIADAVWQTQINGKSGFKPDVKLISIALYNTIIKCSAQLILCCSTLSAIWCLICK